MRVTIDWLRDYIEINTEAEELAEMLTLAGLEAEVMGDDNRVPDSVLVGKVLEVEKHPNADKLSVCKVDMGNNTISQIVCGAPNIAAGQHVPVATIGTRLAENFVIKKSKLRGVESEGMICAEDELGLSEDHEGIMVLGENYEIGRSLNSYFSKPVVLDVELTPNRPDCFSHWGVVREISALTNKSYTFKEVTVNETGSDINDLISIDIQDTEACPRYTARVIQNVKIAPSPQWLKDRLEAIGVRSINNVVDASNYVLMETGHPLHTFDYDKLKGQKIIVRKAVENEKFETLDHKERELSSDTLLICDGEEAVAMAGIMGGTESEVSEQTVNVLIESAYFDPGTVRKGAKQQQLSSEASKRFERGTDPNNTLIYSQNRLAALIHELAGGEIAKGMIDIYPNKIKAKTQILRYDYFKKVIGIDVTADICKAIFTSLDFDILSIDDKQIDVRIPTFRPDVEREIDLVEEVIRLYGFDKLPKQTHINMAVSEKWNELYTFYTEIRSFFIGKGFNETLSNSLVSMDIAEKGIWKYEPLKLQNALSNEMATLRTDITQSLVTNLKFNALRKRSNLRLFELGTVTARNTHSDTGAQEYTNLGGIISSSVWDLYWNESEKDAGIFYVKGLMDQFLQQYKVKSISYKQSENSDFDYLYTIKKKKEVIGFIGQYKQDLFEKYQLKNPVVIFELNLDTILKSRLHKKTYSAVSPYPSSFRDISIVVEKNIPSDKIKNDIRQHGGKNLIDIVTYDEYINKEKLGMNKRALSFRLHFQNAERTMVDKEIDEIMENLFKILYDNHKAELR